MVDREEPVNLDPSEAGFLNTWRTKGVAIGLAGAAALGLVVSQDSGSDRPKFRVGDSTVETLCDIAPLALGEYKVRFGDGPFAPNEAFDAQTPDATRVRDEMIEELPRNTYGVALFSEFLKQQDSPYKVPDVLTAVSKSFNDMGSNEELREETCANVAGKLSAEGKLAQLTAPRLLVLTYEYNEKNELVGLKPTIVDGQTPVDVIGVPDKNGAITFGTVVNPDRDGQFAIVLNEGDMAGQQEAESNGGGTEDTGDDGDSDEGQGNRPNNNRTRVGGTSPVTAPNGPGGTNVTGPAPSGTTPVTAGPGGSGTVSNAPTGSGQPGGGPGVCGTPSGPTCPGTGPGGNGEGAPTPPPTEAPKPPVEEEKKPPTTTTTTTTRPPATTTTTTTTTTVPTKPDLVCDPEIDDC